MKKKNENSKIECRSIITLEGRPVDYVKKVIEKVVSMISERYDVKKKDFSKPEKVGESIYSVFVEIEFSAKNFEGVLGYILDFGPSSIEILEPDEIRISSAELQGILNDLISNIQKMNNRIKVLEASNVILQKKIKKQ